MNLDRWIHASVGWQGTDTIVQLFILQPSGLMTCVGVEADSMNSQEQTRNSNCVAEIHTAERELSAFIHAVAQLFGSKEAKLSAEDWLDESESMGSQPLSTSRNWRAVTVAASARLANRLGVARHPRSDRRANGDAARRVG